MIITSVLLENKCILKDICKIFFYMKEEYNAQYRSPI